MGAHGCQMWRREQLPTAKTLRSSMFELRVSFKTSVESIPLAQPFHYAASFRVVSPCRMDNSGSWQDTVYITYAGKEDQAAGKKESPEPGSNRRPRDSRLPLQSRALPTELPGGLVEQVSTKFPKTSWNRMKFGRNEDR